MISPVMGEVLSLGSLSKLNKHQKADQVIVLVGGCFDILHPGHVIFLEKAKDQGDVLVVLLESDEKVKKLKGGTRPVHNQKERAKVLSALKSVDYVILLPNIEREQEYDEIVLKIAPDIIAATKGIKNASHLKRSTKLVGAKIKYVSEIIGNHSTSRILNENLG